MFHTVGLQHNIPLSIYKLRLAYNSIVQRVFRISKFDSLQPGLGFELNVCAGHKICYFDAGVVS